MAAFRKVIARWLILISLNVLAFAGALSGSATDDNQPRRSIAQELADLRMINYYPARAARSNMWTRWMSAEVDKDLETMSGIGANAVRIALFTTAGGYPHPSSEMIGRLAEFMTLASKHNIKVKLALFGFFTNYADTAGAKTWAQEILANYKDDPRLAYVDLQNEIPRRNPQAIHWAVEILPEIHRLVGNIPVTLSLAGGAMPNEFAVFKAALTPPGETNPLVDFFEMHLYSRAPNAYKLVTETLDAVAPTPLYIGEFGYPTYPDTRRSNPLFGEPWWQANQDQYYRTVLYAAKTAHMPAPAPWIFSDFTPEAWPPPSSKPLPWPWSDARIGIFRVDRTPKPAALTMKRYFNNGGVDVSFNNGFENADSSGLPLNWSIRKPERAHFARDTNVRHSGQASARISQSAPEPKDFPALVTSPVQFILPGESYTASVWAKGRGVTGTANLQVLWIEEHGQLVSKASSRSLSRGDSDWTLLSITSVAPMGANIAELHLGTSNDHGAVWFDDVTFD